MRVYTRAGDDGTTALWGGRRVSKADVLVEVCGTLDEANSWLGLVRSLPLDAWSDDVLQSLQHGLLSLGAEVACGGAAAITRGVVTIEPSHVAHLEAAIVHAEQDLAPLSSLLLPGGSPTASALHVARAVMRRAERRLVGLAEVTEVRRELVAYVNRASDLLFVLARRTNHRMKVQDMGWDTGSRCNEGHGHLPSA